jgi:Transglutaminase-like superfamily
VHNHIVFGYEHSRATRTAFEAYQERRGVCRDYAHLAVAFCRCLNIPARYCTGYITDIGLPPPYAPMDFSAWIEVYLGDRWYAFDPRNNAPRIGRILIAQGRDAADVPLTQGSLVLAILPAAVFFRASLFKVRTSVISRNIRFSIDSRGHCQSVVQMTVLISEPAELTSAACRSCGACCSFSTGWPRFSLESEVSLNIPRIYVDDERGGMIVGPIGPAASKSQQLVRSERVRPVTGVVGS